MALQSTTEHARYEQQLGIVTVVAARRAWRRLDPADLDATALRYRQQVLPVLVAAQEQAAAAGAAYVAKALAEQSIDASPVGRVLISALIGLAADGRPLQSLLQEPITRVKQDIGRGQSVTQAMRSGRDRLDRIVATEVADAGRVAAGVGVAATPTVGYVRRVTPPCCSRCAILAGAFYRWSAGFQRHPQCDCVHVPSNRSEARSLEEDPRQLFDQGQIRGLSKADARAIADGADMNRVVNAHRGMSTAAGRKTTTALAGRRGIPRLRLRPETIYREATSRSDAIRLLRLHGYLT